jgi:Zn-dependent protease
VTRRGWPLPFRAFGIPIELDPSFALVLPLFAWMIGSQVPAFAGLFARLGVDVDPVALSTGMAPWVLGLLAALGLFGSVLLHELGHALVARAYGVRTERITLWFLGGIAQLADLPRQRGAEAVVAIAGPITSGALSLLLSVLLSATSGGAAFVIGYLSFTNLALALFNLLPALPLDGGRVLRSLLSASLGDVRATRIAGGVSRAIAIALGVYGVLSLQIFLVAVAFFVDAAGRAEVFASRARRAFEGRVVRDAMRAEPIAVDLGWSVVALRRLREFRPHTCYPVIDGAGRPIGWLRASDLDALGDDASVAERMMAGESVAESDDLEGALRVLAGAAAGRLFVVDDVGRLSGMLGKADVVRLLQESAT